MHELTIARKIIEIAEEQARTSGITKISSIKVRIGGLTTIVPDALNFCFGFAREDTLAGGAELIIEEVSADAECNACRKTFPVTDAFFLVCPFCGGHDTRLVRGNELDLLSIEGEG